MGQLYYQYLTYENGNQQCVLLQWLDESSGDSIKINKPLTDLSAEEQQVLEDFRLGGEVLQTKTNIQTDINNTELEEG